MQHMQFLTAVIKHSTPFLLCLCDSLAQCEGQIFISLPTRSTIITVPGLVILIFFLLNSANELCAGVVSA